MARRAARRAETRRTFASEPPGERPSNRGSRRPQGRLLTTDFSLPTTDSRLLTVFYRPRPDVDLFLRHRTVGLLAAVPVFPRLEIVEVLLARKQSAVTHVALLVGTADGEPPDELFGHPLWNVLPLIGIDEAEQYDVREQHAPMVAEAHQQPRPVERRPGFAQQVQHVRAVEALALLNERLRPD